MAPNRQPDSMVRRLKFLHANEITLRQKSVRFARRAIETIGNIKKQIVSTLPGRALRVFACREDRP